MADVLALVVVWSALVAPNQPDRLTPMAFLRIPLEGIAVAALALVLPRRATRSTAVTVALLVGVPLGLLSVLKLLELGFFGVLDRPFNLVTDAGHLGSAVGFVRASVGPVAAAGTVAGALLLAAALVIGVPLSVVRVTRLVQRRRRFSMLAVTALAVVWAAGAASGIAGRTPRGGCRRGRRAPCCGRGTGRGSRTPGAAHVRRCGRCRRAPQPERR